MYRFVPSTLRNACAKVHCPIMKSEKPGARSTWNRLWTMGRRRSKSPSSTWLSARWACARARFTAVKVLPSAGEGLVITTVCSGCSVCRWLSRVRSVRNSSAGVSWELLRSSRCDSGAGLKGTTSTLPSRLGLQVQPGRRRWAWARHPDRRCYIRYSFPRRSPASDPGESRRLVPPGVKHRERDSSFLRVNYPRGAGPRHA